jgi:hypothetical protein
MPLPPLASIGSAVHTAHTAAINRLPLLTRTARQRFESQRPVLVVFGQADIKVTCPKA